MKPHIIYILGSGHSGSTILQYLLCNRDAVLGLGEVRHMAAGKGWSETTDGCSCGTAVTSCPAWKEMKPEESETPQNWYARLVQEVAEQYPGKTHWVDTSKTTEGMHCWLDLLSEGRIASLRVIYLVRDVRGWAVSYEARQRRKGRSRRSLALVVNAWRRDQQHFRSFLGQHSSLFQYCIVSYESLVFHNRRQLARLSEFLGFVPASQSETASKAATVHDVFGNRIKHDQHRRASLEYDDRWQYRFAINLLALCQYRAWNLNTALRYLGGV